MKFFSAILALVAVGVVSASLDRHFPRDQPLPAHWTRATDKTVNANERLSLRVSLFPRNARMLERTLIDVSTPGSKHFRQYWSKDQIRALVGRNEHEIDELRSFFASHGLTLTNVHPHKDWIFVEGPAKAIEETFRCELGVFQHRIRADDTRVATLKGYSVPGEIAHLVNFVAGMNTFSFSHWSADGNKENNNQLTADTYLPVTPDTIYERYGAPSKEIARGSTLGSQAVIEFGQTANFNEADLQAFFQKYQSDLSGEVCTMAYGENNGSIRPSVEANLDVQYMMAAGVHVNTTDYKLVSSKGIEDQFLDYTILVNSQYMPPLVHSISYGEYGGSYDNVTDQQFSYELQKMGLSGISVLLASGDNGVGCNNAGTSLEFDYPSSPYITMVGATQIEKNGEETGATLSSGGFSEDFPLADWQATVVNDYLDKNAATLPKQWFNKAGRAYPDISAFGQNVQVMASGKVQSVAGTSCSAPIFGGLIAQINSDLMKQGQAPLGFLNPWLYGNPQMFIDITKGSNPYQKCSGFQAASGWDPVTGLGSPIYSELHKAAFAALQK